jgi:hypothetical protein
VTSRDRRDRRGTSRRGGRSSPSGAVDPILALTPYAWYRADDVTLSGADATAIRDRSGNGRDLTAGTAAAYVASSHGGQPALDFDSASTEHYVAGSTSVGDFGTDDFTNIHVAHLHIAATSMLMAKWDGGDGWFNFFNATRVWQVRADGTTGVVTDSEGTDTTEIHCLRHRHLYGVSETAVVDGSGTATAGATGPVSNSLLLTLGARSSTLINPFDGHWQETLIFNRDLTSGELATVRDYLNDRYTGFGLSSI